MPGNPTPGPKNRIWDCFAKTGITCLANPFINLPLASGKLACGYKNPVDPNCCGEQWDVDLGLYYNRARYLNTDSGRFWNADSYEGNRADPQSLHKYLYANANAVSGSDPAGLWTLIELQAVAFNIGIRIIPVATNISFFVAEMAGVSTIGYGAARGAVALGTQAERALPPGLSLGELFSAAIKLPKGAVVGCYRFVTKAIGGTGAQANHLNQTAAFPNLSRADDLVVSLEGGVHQAGSEHWRFHRVLEEFWSAFRRGGTRSGETPTNAEYSSALRNALAETKASGAAEDLVRLAEKSRAASGYHDGPGGLLPEVPGPLPMAK